MLKITEIVYELGAIEGALDNQINYLKGITEQLQRIRDKVESLKDRTNAPFDLASDEPKT